MNGENRVVSKSISISLGDLSTIEKLAKKEGRSVNNYIKIYMINPFLAEVRNENDS